VKLETTRLSASGPQGRATPAPSDRVSPVKRDRIVIAGAGIAGLVAAAATADMFDEVIVVDPDSLAGQVGAHPPRTQLHNVLTRGQRHLEALLPGFRRRFLDAGGAEGDVCLDTHVYEFGGDAFGRSLGLSIWSAPWESIWGAARALLPANVQVRHGTTVAGLEAHGRRVGRVRLVGENCTEVMDVAALVDASGHGSRFDRLLDAAGVAVPRVERQRLDRWFITVRLRRPPGMVGRPDFWMTFADPPHRQVALMSPLGSDEWDLSVESQEPFSTPPTNFEGVLAFLDELPGPPLRPVAEAATPLGPPAVFRRREARWRHYEEIDTPLAGFFPVGDSFVSTNPVHGQGIGVAAWQASILRESLSTGVDAAEWTQPYLKAAGRAARQAWDLDSVPVPAISISDWVTLGQGMAANANLQRRYVGIWHLIEPVSSLHHLVRAAEAEVAVRTEGPR